MNFQGGAHYIIMFVTRQLPFLLRQHICHITPYTNGVCSTLTSETFYNTASNLSLIITAVKLKVR
jgi:hypothetical protein